MQVEFPPDLCSRVTFVNFTVTRGSLQSQCLNQVLKAERPDVDAKRSDLLKLQGVLVQGIASIPGVFRKNFQGEQTNVSRNRGLELNINVLCCKLY